MNKLWIIDIFRHGSSTSEFANEASSIMKKYEVKSIGNKFIILNILQTFLHSQENHNDSQSV